MGIVLHPLSEDSQDPIVRLPRFFFFIQGSRYVPREGEFKFFLCQGHLALSDVLHGACQQGRNPWPSECPTELCLILLASLIRPTSSQD